MRSLWVDRNFKYDGSQLRSLFAYLEFGLQGDSIVSWVGPCDIPIQHMVDGEDKLAKATICGDLMLHFIVERFGAGLETMVVWQRLLANIVRDIIWSQLAEGAAPTALGGASALLLRRDGDDLFLAEKKLSISIATVSPVSGLMHFAVNVENSGTPVPTLSLKELGLEAGALARAIMQAFVVESADVRAATCKVHWVK